MKLNLCRLTREQESLWLDYCINPDSFVYNVALFVKIEGNLNIKQFINSVEIVKNHFYTVGRTKFKVLNGVPYQYLTDKTGSNYFEFIDLTKDSESSSPESILVEKSKILFKLEHEIPVRSVLIKHNDNTYYYGYIQHHILSDAVSIDLFCKGISLVYNNNEKIFKEKFQQRDLNDYVRFLKNDSSDINYWKDKLKNVNVKLDFKRTESNSARDTRGVVKFHFEERYISEIKLAAINLGTTPYLFMKVVFGILLYKYWGQKDIIINYAYNARKGDFQKNTGMFIKILPFKFCIRDEVSTKELVNIAKEERKKDSKNMNISYLDIINIYSLNKENKTRKANISFSQTRFEYDSLILDSCDVTSLNVLGADTGDEDINFVYDPYTSVFKSAIYYNEGLFSEEFVCQIVRCYKSLVLTIVSNLDVKVGDLDIVAPREKDLILNDFNNTKVDYPREKCIHHLFEDQVAKAPDNVAIVFETSQLTYSELNEKSNQLAHYLQERGVKPETLVGICVDRSLEMIIGLLGILKAGGAYVPIDPAYPEDRISYMLDDAGCGIVLTQEHIGLVQAGTEVIYLDSDWDNIGNSPTSNVISGVKSDNLAYVIYTSGSTGKPKGTLIEHKSVIRLVSNGGFSFLRNPKVVLQYATISFDASIFEIWGSLCNGSQLIVCPPRNLGIDELGQIIKQFKIEVLWLTSGLFSLVVENGITMLEDVKYLLAGGDVLNKNHVARVLETHKSMTVINGYGPTESTTFASLYFMTQQSAINASVPIGKPLDNTGLYILDKNQKLVPIGIAGELCISGDGLARGYLNQPELTAEQFIKNPFSDDPQSRLYKTGDLARYLPDGNIEFLGRLDDQVKIRGFRIELGEIESVLNTQEGVNTSVVLAKEVSDGNKQLVAYIVPSRDTENDASLNIRELREELSKTLPDYMVPSLFVRLDAMPLTSNGKVDKKALPEPEGNLEMTNEYVAASTEIEKKLVDIWQELLGVERVGIHDNFFELGGHSLVATQVASKIRTDLNIELPLKTLITSPTVAQLFRKITSINAYVEQFPEIVINAQDRYKPFPLTDVQQSYWIGRGELYDLGGVGAHAYSESHIAALDIDRLNQVINHMIKRHDMLRMVVTEDGQQRILERVEPYKIPILDLRETSQEEEKQKFMSLRDKLSHQLFSGLTWPLFDMQVCIFRDGACKLLFSMDALVFDASSYGIFINELVNLYKDYSYEPPELSLSFRDYVIAEQSLKKTEFYKRSMQYWLDRINSIPRAPELPLAKLPGEIANVKFSKQRLQLSSSKWEILKDRISSSGVTPTVFIIQCFAEVMRRWSKVDHFTLNLTLFNRLPFHKEVNNVLGDFTSLNLLEIDYRNSKDFRTRLKDTQFQLWNDLEHKYYSGVEVQRKLSQVAGYTVTMPIVVTSVLGIEVDAEGLSQLGTLSHEEGLSDIKRSYSIAQTPQVWIDCQITEKKGRLQIDWDSVKELFPEGMLEAMFGAFESLLTGFIEDKGLWATRQIELLPYHQLSIQSEVNNSTKKYPDKLLHELFTEQVKVRGKKVAIRTNSKTISYQELYQKSVQIGDELRNKGAKPNQLVAIIMHKGWEQVVASLGVQFSGAAYLPIDASLPQQRILQLLEIGEANIVVSLSYILEELSLGGLIQTLVLDKIKYRNKAEIKDIAYQNSNDLAYVIFTSGSTGEPKGVMIDHQGAVNTILDINSRFDITEKDSCFAISSLSFDLSVYDVFGMLSAGGTIVIPEPSEQKDPDAWGRYIEQENVTIWNSVPALMQMLVEYNGGNKKCSSLRKALLSGDWIPVDLPDRIRELCSDVEVISLGGATEASIWSIYYPIRQVHPGWKSIPYGKPLSNQSLYVLKQDLTASPLWVPGNLYIGGKGLALGYWRDEEKTASSFIIHPETGERLYKTGDMGRYLPDGNIEFLGREDSQVKIGGFRVELGEIESVLNRQKEVSTSAVLTKEDKAGNKQLVAYVVSPKDNGKKDGLNIEKLREELSKILPYYMVPSLFVRLESMPLTPNGKVDKKALPEPEGNFELINEYVAPETEIEKKLTSIWQELLGVEKIGIQDNFFELGGHSILVTQVISKIRTEFNNELPLNTLFESTTIQTLSKRINADRLNEGHLKPIPAIIRKGDIPLSFAQERLWFIDQYEHNASYNMPLAAKLFGGLSISVLEKALTTIINRHEVLRTNFVTTNNGPKQVIQESASSNLEIVDLSHLSKEAANKQILDSINKESQKTFDLAKDSLIRFILYTVNEEEFVLFINHHHIITDGWSFSILINEITQIYEAYSNGKPSPLTDLPIQYADYAIWQRAYLEGERLQKQATYWKGKLEGVAILELPTDKPRPKEQTFNGNTVCIHLNKCITNKLNLLSQGNNATLFMTLLSIFKILLNKYAGQSDICVGSPITNRTREEVEGLIGVFVNTLAIRSDVDTELRFNEFLGRIRAITLEAYDNQDIPFEKVVDIVQPERNLVYSPLFQVMMVLQNNPRGELKISRLQYEDVAIERFVSRFDITLGLTEMADGLYGSIEYNTDLFDRATIERLGKHFIVLVEQVIENPGTQIKDLEILTPEEKHQLLVEWNATEVDYPRGKCIHHLFEDQVAKTPDNVAIVFETSQLTYSELNEKSNQLAHYLQERGVKPETLVGICVDRSLEMIIGLLGILKAGGAYVPIDPAYPEDRISYMLEDAGCGIVLTQEHIGLVQAGTEVIYLDSDWDNIGNSPTSNVISGVKSDNLAYVIYTSGSTGKPKGTIINHSSVQNLIQWHNREFRVSEKSKSTQLANIAFDASVWEIWPYLTCGSSLYLVKKEYLTDTKRIIEYLNVNSISHSFIPTAIAESILSQNWVKNTSLNYVLIGGDRFKGNNLNIDNCKFKLINNYGPTENTVVSTSCEINDSKLFSSIGKPIDNTKVYILDNNLNLTPIGIAGELCISGDGLARGYLNQPELTAEQFIKNPFSDDPQSRLYKTGDLARYLPDGNIEFLGRLDDQVKIRGFRIELGEIESVLNTQEGVNTSVVLAKEVSDGNKQLVAYIVPSRDTENDASLNIRELREELSKTLPDYMVPSLFVRLDAMPLTSNGKVDKKALPEPEGNLEMTNEYVAASTEIEKKLVDIWQELLGVERVGIHDNFFELGGHSLVATQVASKIRTDLNIELPLKTLITSPTVAQLFRKITSINAYVEQFPEIVINAQDRYKPFPLTDVQQSYWIGRGELYDLGGVGAHAYSESHIAALDIDRLNQVINHMIKRHDMLRMVVTEDGQQRILERVEPYKIPILDLRETSQEEEKQKFMSLRDKLSHQLFSGLTWPLFDMQVCIFRDGACKLLFSMDALVFDASSYGIFINELVNLYKDYSYEPPELSLSFRDYVIAEQSLKKTEFYKRSMQYWLDRINSIPRAPELPLAKLPGEIANVKFSKQRLQLSSSKWEILKDRISSSGVTPTVFIIQCFAEVMRRWSKVDHFTLNLTLFNRLPFHKEVNNVLGDFTSLNLLEIDYRNSKDFRTRLKDTQFQLWNDLEHKYYSGVEVQRKLSQVAGYTVTMPIVVTSVLGIEVDAEGLSQLGTLSHEEGLSDIKRSYSIAQTPQVWIDCQITEKKGRLQIDWDSVKELFPEGMLEAMFGAFESLLTGFIEDKGLWATRQIELLPYHQLSIQSEVNNSTKKYPDKLLHELFTEQVKVRGKKVAIRTNSKTISYQELYQKSVQIGDELRNKGAKPNQLVAIIMHKGWEQVVASLGVQFSGAAYLPIDASLPQQRILQLLEIGEANIVVSLSYILEELSLGGLIQTLVLDKIKYRNKAEIKDIAYQNSNDLAYVIFTSGSTGEPKGVMIDHQGAVNTILDINSRFDITEKDSCFAISSLSFDLSVYDVFGMLSAGGTIVIPEPSEQKDPDAWGRYIEQENVTIWNSVPALMQMLVEYNGGNKKCSSLRKALLSGDWIPVDLPDRIRELCSDVEVISLGGATEASIWSIYYPIRQVHPGWKSIPYGKPLSNQSLYVLKQDLTASPLWVPGNLYIGGKGLALGYWRDEEKTASSFIIHPETGERLYKTGDMGRYLPDGNIEFLGREDSQVKIGGFRVELGEIESVLNRQKEVSTSAVLTKEDKAGNKQLVAYVVSPKDNGKKDGLNIEKLREELSKILPYYMVPSLFVRLESMPLTPNGKVDKKALPEPERKVEEDHIAPFSELEDALVEIWAEVLGINKNEISLNNSFFEIGGNSLLIVKLKNKLCKLEQFKYITVPELFKNHSIKMLVQSTQQDNLTGYKLQRGTQTDNHEIAIIGMSGAFSGVSNIAEFWQLIKNQDEGLRFYSQEECAKLGVELSLCEDTDYIPVAGHIKNIDQFDPLFWDMSPNEAKLLDPQIRKFIEHCWFVLEASGYIHRRKDLNIGVFAGSGNNSYYYNNILNGKMASEINMWEAGNSNSKDALATMTSYRLDLSGPANSINTACSTGLVSVIEACKNLQLGACEMALAGGVTLIQPNQTGYVYKEGMVLSRNGHCRTFDEDASGTIESSGVGVVLLKRLEDAVKDNDTIVGVIKGYATNNDGARKTGYTAPSVIGQAECIINAQKMAGVFSSEIDYIECHGTATTLGDPIEIQALTEAFEFNRPKESTPKHKTVLGAVKANIGHAKTAAGTAGLIKACLMLQNNIIPGQVNFNNPNPKLNIEQTNFEIAKKNKEWLPNLDRRRIAGVSAFGVGGTNAHVIIGDYIPDNKKQLENEVSSIASKENHGEPVNYIVPISAKCKESLELYNQQLAKYLGDAFRHICIEDIAYTLQEKREHFNYRSAYCARNIDELIQGLNESSSIRRQVTPEIKNKIVFMFSGQGQQYPCMAKELYDNEQYFKTTIDKLILLANRYLDVDLYEVLYPSLDYAQNSIDEIEYSAVSLFIVEYALAKYLEHLGIEADAYIGHSFGEYVAATLSNVFNLEDAIKVVITRGRLMQSMQQGSMLAINSIEEKIKAVVEEHNCEISVINSIEDFVASGLNSDIEKLKDVLERQNIPVIKLNSFVAGHSRLMDKAAIEFESVFESIKLNKPTKYFATNLSGEIANEEVITASYWCKQLRNTVQFATGIDCLAKKFNYKINFIAVGAGKGLSSFVTKYKNINNKKAIQSLHLLPSIKENTQTFNKLKNKEDILAKLWASGIVDKPNDIKLFKRSNTLTDLPNYQFNFKKCWLEVGNSQVTKRYNPVEDMFYKRSWERIDIPKAHDSIESLKHKNILILVNEKGKKKSDSLCLINTLNSYCDDFGYVIHKQCNNIISDFTFELDNASHIDKIFDEKTQASPIDIVIYISSSIDIDNPCLDIFAIRNTFDWASKTNSRIPKFISISFNNYQVIGNELLEEKPSIVYGVTKSIPFEYSTMDTIAYHVDLSSTDLNNTNALFSTLVQNDNVDFVAVRGDFKWFSKYQHASYLNRKLLTNNSEEASNPTFLITGGLGGVGYTYANHLAQKDKKCTIILLGRTKESNLREDYKTRLENLSKTKHRIIYEAIDIGSVDAVIRIGEILKTNGITAIEIVLHSAGVGAKRVINDKTRGDIVQVVHPKILGVENLIELAGSIRINYLVSCSSVFSIMPSFGNMEYTAANLYLDELSHRSHPGVNYMLTVNLNQISDIGMAVDFINESTSKVEKSDNTIKSHEFLAAIEKLIQSKIVNNLIFSRYDLSDIYYENIASLRSLKGIITSRGTVEIIEDNYTETEFKIAQIWNQVLGIEEIGLHDNFFDLGGHSLHATQVISKIRAEFDIELALRVLFEVTSIIDLARIIDSSDRKANVKRLEKIKKRKFEQTILSSNEDSMLNEFEI